MLKNQNRIGLKGKRAFPSVLLILLLFVFLHPDLAAQSFHKRIITATLDSIYVRDQHLRERLIYLDQHWRDDLQLLYDSLWTLQKTYDRINMKAVNDLNTSYGWDTLMGLDSASRSTIFLVIQHSDSLNQINYLPLLYRAVKKGYLPPEDYAMLKDRITLLQTKQQDYGTQYYWDNTQKKNILFRINGGAEAADKRRMELGLIPLQDYLSYINCQ